MFPSRCKDEAHICNSNFDMRRFCPKTCGDCGEGIFSLKTYVKPDKKQMICLIINTHINFQIRPF